MSDYNSSHIGTTIDEAITRCSGLTGNIQTQLDGKEATLTKGNLTEATSSILTIIGGTNAIIGSGVSIEVSQVSGSSSGYLSSVDWNTFNNKQSTLDIESIEGTTNQITVTNGTNTIISATPVILSLPQNINTGANVEFANLDLSGITADRALIINGANRISSSSVTSTTLGYLDATSSVQNQIDSKQKEIYKTVDLSGNGDYTGLKEALDDGATKIFVKNGTYLEATPISITSGNVEILGENIEDTVIQFGAGQDGLLIYSNYNLVRNLTLDSATNTSTAALVIGDGQSTGNPDTSIGNNNTIQYCRIQGSSSAFALYVAGASYYTSTPTLQAFENNDLQYNNKIEYCILESTYTGDAFSFSLQKDGSFSNNYVSGGRIAVYMCRNTNCCNNSIVDSSAQGIFIWCPAYNNNIVGNKIYNSSSSSIQLENQLEHTPLLDDQRGFANNVSNNMIFESNNSGIEITGDADHEPKNNNFNNNTIFKPDNHGIYMQDAHYNNFVGNSIYQPRSDSGTYSRGSGFYLVQNVENNNINNNVIADDRDPYVLHCAIGNREGTDCPNNSVVGNKIIANNTERTVWIQSNGWNVSSNYISGGYYAGIYLDQADNCNVVSNVCENNTNQANDAYYEIWLNNTANNNIVTNNTCISSAANVAASNVIVSSGSGNIIENNVGIGTTAEYASIVSGLQDMGTSTGIVSQTGNTSFSKRTITGTSNQITVTNGDGVSGNPTLSTPQDIDTSADTTFNSTILAGLTADRALYANGSKSITSSNATSTELEYLSGVSSNIQTQIDSKENTFDVNNIEGTANQITVVNGTNTIVSATPVTLSLPQDIHVSATPTFAEINITGLSTERILTSDSNNNIVSSNVTNTTLGYLDATSSIQTQLNNKQTLDSTLTALAAYNTNGLITQTASDTFTGRTITGTANQVTVTNGDGVSGNPTLSLPQDIATTSSPTFAGASLTGETTITRSGDSTWKRGLKVLSPDLTSGHFIQNSWGVADNAKNGANMAFYYISSGSDSNFGSLGLHSVDGVIKWYGDGTITLDGATTITGTTTLNNLTASKVLTLDGSKNIVSSYDLDQSLATTSSPTFADMYLTNLDADRVLYLNGSKLVATGAVTSGDLAYIAGQDQYIKTTSSPTFAGGTMVQTDQNALTQLRVRNDSSGINAYSVFRATYGDNTQFIAMFEFSPDYTGSGLHAGGYSVLSSNGSLGLNVCTQNATSLVLGTNNIKRMEFTSVGNGIFGQGLSTYFQLYGVSAGNSNHLIFGNETGDPEKSIFMSSYWLHIQAHEDQGLIIRTTDATATYENMAKFNGSDVSGAAREIWLWESGSGKVSINNSSPSYALDVTGEINATGGFRDNGTAGIDTTFVDNDGNTITVSGGIITAKTAP